MANPIKGHIVESFNEEMQREHKKVLEMGALLVPLETKTLSEVRANISALKTIDL